MIHQPSLVLRHPSLALPVDGSVVEPAISQRRRLLDAMVQSVSEKGYAATTVREIVKTAGVSRTTFYEHFDGKEGCFGHAYLLGTEVMLQAIATAIGEIVNGDWLAQLRVGIKTYLDILSREDACARTFILEVVTAGEPARGLRDDVHRAFASNFRRSLRQAQAADPTVPNLPEESLLAIVAAFEELVGRLVRLGATNDLATLEPVLTHLATAILLGNPAANALKIGEPRSQSRLP